MHFIAVSLACMPRPTMNIRLPIPLFPPCCLLRSIIHERNMQPSIVIALCLPTLIFHETRKYYAQREPWGSEIWNLKSGLSKSNLTNLIIDQHYGYLLYCAAHLCSVSNYWRLLIIYLNLNLPLVLLNSFLVPWTNTEQIRREKIQEDRANNAALLH